VKLLFLSWIFVITASGLAQTPLRNEQWVILTAQQELRQFIAGENIRELRLEAEAGCQNYLPLIRYILLQDYSPDSLVITQRDSVPVLHFYRFELKTGYLSKSGFFQGWRAELERKLELAGTVGLIVPGDQSKIYKFDRVLTDRIKKSQKPEVEAGLFTYFTGEIEPSGWWQVWLEPVLLTAGSAVFGYLFYSVRS